ncbi:type II toxin-antitoxin system death-on-curing family toxin [Paenibacillus herberti]|uniref:Type II toxin-antitoxin system death-on-curing family toxin n=1 Tax=Paenibacillus herberti TaxID=1619309 RepID=A0A229NYH5_9BACL|nr:Fic family protein [Paenibacillus herberti]OXM14930.1 type II toxin-antitoxin system death-on-curing family toxin [Paenibacillus herberti]
MNEQLTVPQLLEIHMMHQDRFNVSPGFRNPGFLLQLVDRPLLEGFVGSDDASTLVRQAALYWHGLARAVAFRDGNAATAIHAMMTFLLLNGIELDVPEDELVEAAILCVSWKMDLEECEEWIRRYLR